MEKKYLNDSGLMHFWGKIKSYIKSVSDALQGQINDKQEQITANKSAQDTKNASLDENMKKLNTRDDQITETLKNIAATGGASVASAVTYDNTTSQLTSANIQGAVDELQGAKIDKTSILQELGEAEDKVMSQKAVSRKLFFYDCSKGGTVTHDSLQDAIGAVPSIYRKLGLTIGFLASNNKYYGPIYAKLQKNSWSNDVKDWALMNDRLVFLSGRYTKNIYVVFDFNIPMAFKGSNLKTLYILTKEKKYDWLDTVQTRLKYVYSGEDKAIYPVFSFEDNEYRYYYYELSGFDSNIHIFKYNNKKDNAPSTIEAENYIYVQDKPFDDLSSIMLNVVGVTNVSGKVITSLNSNNLSIKVYLSHLYINNEKYSDLSNSNYISNYDKNKYYICNFLNGNILFSKSNTEPIYYPKAPLCVYHNGDFSYINNGIKTYDDNYFLINKDKYATDVYFGKWLDSVYTTEKSPNHTLSLCVDIRDNTSELGIQVRIDDYRNKGWDSTELKVNGYITENQIVTIIIRDENGKKTNDFVSVELNYNAINKIYEHCLLIKNQFDGNAVFKTYCTANIIKHFELDECPYIKEHFPVLYLNDIPDEAKDVFNFNKFSSSFDRVIGVSDFDGSQKNAIISLNENAFINVSQKIDTLAIEGNAYNVCLYTDKYEPILEGSRKKFECSHNPSQLGLGFIDENFNLWEVTHSDFWESNRRILDKDKAILNTPLSSESYKGLMYIPINDDYDYPNMDLTNLYVNWTLWFYATTSKVLEIVEIDGHKYASVNYNGHYHAHSDYMFSGNYPNVVLLNCYNHNDNIWFSPDGYCYAPITVNQLYAVNHDAVIDNLYLHNVKLHLATVNLSKISSKKQYIKDSSLVPLINLDAEIQQDVFNSKLGHCCRIAISGNKKSCTQNIFDNVIFDTGISRSNFGAISCGNKYHIKNNRIVNYGYYAILAGVNYLLGSKEDTLENYPYGCIEDNIIEQTDDYFRNARNYVVSDGGAIHIVTTNKKCIVRNNFVNKFNGRGADRQIFCDDGCCNVYIYNNRLRKGIAGNSIDVRYVKDGGRDVPTSTPLNDNRFVGFNFMDNSIVCAGNPTDTSKNVKCFNNIIFNDSAKLSIENTNLEYINVRLNGSIDDDGSVITNAEIP